MKKENQELFEKIFVSRFMPEFLNALSKTEQGKKVLDLYDIHDGHCDISFRGEMFFWRQWHTRKD
jgi:hypothetical protein